VLATPRDRRRPWRRPARRSGRRRPQWHVHRLSARRP
jgi:hypothetical protein